MVYIIEDGSGISRTVNPSCICSNVFPLKTLFNQEGKNFEFYQMVGGEKLGINKYIEKNIPKNPTTGTLLGGEVAEIAGSVMDPFLAYGIVKGATNALKTKAPVAIEETIDPTRRDLLKMGAVITGGAIVYPTAKKLGLLDTSVKVAKTGNAVRIATSGVVNNMPEFFPYLSEFSLAKGKVIGEDYMRSGMTEFKRELTIPLEITTGGKKTNVKLLPIFLIINSPEWFNPGILCKGFPYIVILFAVYVDLILFSLVYVIN